MCVCVFSFKLHNSFYHPCLWSHSMSLLSLFACLFLFLSLSLSPHIYTHICVCVYVCV